MISAIGAAREMKGWYGGKLKGKLVRGELERGAGGRGLGKTNNDSLTAFKAVFPEESLNKS